MSVDSSLIGNALVAKLGADATLLALCPNGIYIDEAPPGSTRFVIVSLVYGQDEGVFGGRAFEDHLYLVEARMLSTSGGDAHAAAVRIDALLEDGDLSIDGYELMTMHREEPVRNTELDAVDPSIRWTRRGGRYRVQASVLETPLAPSWMQSGWAQ
jgi:hypothetical protein